MEADFWHQRWQENRIGFHLTEVNPYLVEFWPLLGIRPPARVFVPLCGKSLDLRWLLDEGYQIEGVELSELAIEAFCEEQQLACKQVCLGGWSVWEAENLRLWCGDFFALDAAHLGAVEAVYDRAALIALPTTMRQHYVRHLAGLAGDAPQLLITLEYSQEQMDGPPFAVAQSEVQQLYGTRYTGAETPCLRADVLSASPNLRERGLSRLDELVYVLRARQK